MEVPQVSEVRKRRVSRYEKLLDRFSLPLLSFTMTTGGQAKTNPLIQRGFQLGKALLRGQFARAKADIVFSEEADDPDTCEVLYVVNLSPATLKEIIRDIEDHAELGYLYHVDIYMPNGDKLDNSSFRRCLICGRPARKCAQSKTHTEIEIRSHIHALLIRVLDAHEAETAASLAIRALLYEVCVTPKPGLVDRFNNGSHRDMDIFTFMNSSSALWPYFRTCVDIGRRTAAQPAVETLSALRWPGKLAEASMLQATEGVNTHKGAIFSLGLACAALGRLNWESRKSPEKILEQVSAMTAGLSERELEGLTKDTVVTAGQRIYLEYGITGIRGQAEAGFPTVLEHGLATLENGLAEGRSNDEAGSAALLALLAHTTDTNMISRGGIEIQQEETKQLQLLLETVSYPNQDILRDLDQKYIRLNLSPGGTADLLALCWFLHFLRGSD